MQAALVGIFTLKYVVVAYIYDGYIYMKLMCFPKLTKSGFFFFFFFCFFFLFGTNWLRASQYKTRLDKIHS